MSLLIKVLITRWETELRKTSSKILGKAKEARIQYVYSKIKKQHDLKLHQFTFIQLKYMNLFQQVFFFFFFAVKHIKVFN